MHAISSYHGNRSTNTHTQTNPQTGPITIHCAAKISAQCNEYTAMSQLLQQLCPSVCLSVCHIHVIMVSIVLTLIGIIYVYVLLDGNTANDPQCSQLLETSLSSTLSRTIQYNTCQQNALLTALVRSNSSQWRFGVAVTRWS